MNVILEKENAHENTDGIVFRDSSIDQIGREKKNGVKDI